MPDESNRAVETLIDATGRMERMQSRTLDAIQELTRAIAEGFARIETREEQRGAIGAIVNGGKGAASAGIAWAAVVATTIIALFTVLSTRVESVDAVRRESGAAIEARLDRIERRSRAEVEDTVRSFRERLGAIEGRERDQRLAQALGESLAIQLRALEAESE